MFAFDRDHLVVRGGRDILRRLAVYLDEAPRFKHLPIEGHTDFMGRVAYIQELSLRRRHKSCIFWWTCCVLMARKSTLLVTGSPDQLGDNGNFQGQQLNRRVEIKIMW